MRITGNGGNTISKLRKSPTGRKLLEAAERKGVKINFVPNDGSKTLGNYNPNNNTITVKSNNIETMVETLGHELVHANTRGNGNSMKEEKTAFIVGEKIAQEAGVNYKPHSDSYWSNHVNKSYSGLASDNGILKDLCALDVNPFSADGSGSSGSSGSSGKSGSTGNISNANSSSPCSGSSCSNNATDGSDSGNNSSLDPQNAMGCQNQNQNQNPFMQMLLMMMQMIMAMMGMQNNQQGNNNSNMANSFSSSNPFNTIPFQQA